MEWIDATWPVVPEEVNRVDSGQTPVTTFLFLKVSMGKNGIFSTEVI
jgi:hypothetical protein